MTIINIVHNEGHLKQILRYFPGGGTKYGEVAKDVSTAQNIATKLKMMGFLVVIHRFRHPGHDFNVYQVYRSVKKTKPGDFGRDIGRCGSPKKKRKTNKTTKKITIRRK